MHRLDQFPVVDTVVVSPDISSHVNTGAYNKPERVLKVYLQPGLGATRHFQNHYVVAILRRGIRNYEPDLGIVSSEHIE